MTRATLLAILCAASALVSCGDPEKLSAKDSGADTDADTDTDSDTDTDTDVDSDTDSDSDTDTDTDDPLPEIRVTYCDPYTVPAEIESGGTIDFGDVGVDGDGGEVSYLFEIVVHNDGNGELTLALPALDGADASSWELNSEGFLDSLAPDDSTTFWMTFDPLACGELGATVSVENDDSDENPFVINPSGAGLNVDSNAIPPVPGDDGTISLEDKECRSVNLVWTTATDECTASSNLFYAVYQSESDNMSTVDDVLTNGTQIMNWTSGATSFGVTSLNPNQDYWFNVLVEDESNNRAAYTTATTTTRTPIRLFAADGNHDGNLGGRTGADSLCEDTWTATYSETLPGDNIRAFLSVTEVDDIADMPDTYGLPTDCPFAGPTAIEIAYWWTDLVDASISNTLYDADILSSTGESWWSGSSWDGSINVSESCDSWNTAVSGGGRGLRDPLKVRRDLRRSPTC